MLHYPNINPIAIQLGPFKIYWYGLMYLFGFASAWLLGAYRSKKFYSPIQTKQVGDVIFYIAIGVIIGGRMGYILLYNLLFYLHNPVKIIYIWDGGMSFHGGFIGVLLAFALYAKRYNINFFDLGEFFAPMVPIGLGAGRMGNFINGELCGKVTDLPIGMLFPRAGPLPRYTSQLFEFFLEGVLLFIILWVVTIKPRPRYLVFGLFMFIYGMSRCTCELFREPDPQYGYIFFNYITIGQILSIPMIIFGLALLIYILIRKKY